MGNKHILTVPGRYDQVRKIVAFVADGAGKAGLDENAVFHVELCCDEACTNIIEHAYGSENQGKITVSYELTADSFTITVQDNGRAFNPKAIPPPPLPPIPPAANATSDEIIRNLKIGGLGIHFMRQLMDEVHFSFEANGGNTLVMVKKLSRSK